MQQVRAEGTFVAVGGATQFQMIDKDKRPIYVMIGQNTKVQVSGGADIDYLKAGVCVEFLAEVPKGGIVTEKLDKLSVFTPSTDRPLGLAAAELAARAKKDEKDKEGGEKGPDAKEKPLAPDPGLDAPSPKARTGRAKPRADQFGSEAPAAKSGRGAAALQPPGTFTVRGTVKSCTNGKLRVSPGRGPVITVDLAEGAEIDVDSTDIRLAQRDDKVSVTGKAMQNRVMAESVTIELSSRLSSGKKRVPHAPAAAKSLTTKPLTKPIRGKKDAGDMEPQMEK